MPRSFETPPLHWCRRSCDHPAAWPAKSRPDQADRRTAHRAVPVNLPALARSVAKSSARAGQRPAVILRCANYPANPRPAAPTLLEYQSRRDQENCEAASLSPAPRSGSPRADQPADPLHECRNKNSGAARPKSERLHLPLPLAPDQSRSGAPRATPSDLRATARASEAGRTNRSDFARPSGRCDSEEPSRVLRRSKTRRAHTTPSARKSMQGKQIYARRERLLQGSRRPQPRPTVAATPASASPCRRRMRTPRRSILPEASSTSLKSNDRLHVEGLRKQIN